MCAIALTFVTVFFTPVALPEVQGQPATEDTPAVKAARARQEAVKTLDIKFRLKEVIAQGGLSARRPAELRPKQPVPPAELTLESTNRLVIDGGKVRYENNHPAWRTGDSAVIKKQVVVSCNGSAEKRFFPEGVYGGARPYGIIEKGVRLDFVGGPELAPILWSFHGLNPALHRAVIGRLKPTGGTLLIDGSVCQEYILRASERMKDLYWLDPKKEHVIVRWQRLSRVIDQLDVRYRLQDGTWVPESWVRTQSAPDGTVFSRTTADVVEMRLNEPQPAELFELRFPPGTLIQDNHDLPTAKMYWVEGDGRLRELSAAGGEPLPPVPPGGDSWLQDNQGLLIALGLALLAQVVALVWWRKRRNVTPQGPVTQDRPNPGSSGQGGAKRDTQEV
jgi:hypothetical protein